MKTKDVGILVFRIMAIYTFLKTPTFTGSVFYFFSINASRPGMNSIRDILGLMLVCFPFLLYLLIAIFLWVKADIFAGYLLSNIEEKEFSLPVSVLELQSIAFSTIGIFLIVKSLPSLFQALFLYSQRTIGQPIQGNQNLFVISFLELIIGGILTLSSTKLVDALTKVRRSLRPNWDKDDSSIE